MLKKKNFQGFKNIVNDEYFVVGLKEMFVRVK